MKKMILLLMSIVSLMFISCDVDYSSPAIQKETQRARVDFSYKVVQPLSVTITDKSVGDYVLYDFGDGTSKQYNIGTTFNHRYTSPGVYKIKGKATGNGSDDYTVSVTINKPDVYIIGIKYNKVDEDGEYYRAVLKDDDFFTTKWINTEYTSVLNNSRLPYSFIFKNPVIMDGLSDDEYYTLYVYHSTSVSKDGTQCLKQDILTRQFLEYPSSIVVNNNSGNTQVELLMEYR